MPIIGLETSKNILIAGYVQSTNIKQIHMALKVTAHSQLT